MTNEEIQRTMEFIIQRQEEFAGNMEKFAENMKVSESRMNRMETAFVGIFNMVAETAKAQKELAVTVSELVTAQAQTDERLSALINTVERYISEGRNGKA